MKNKWSDSIASSMYENLNSKEYKQIFHTNYKKASESEEVTEKLEERYEEPEKKDACKFSANLTVLLDDGESLNLFLTADSAAELKKEFAAVLDEVSDLEEVLSESGDDNDAHFESREPESQDPYAPFGKKDDAEEQLSDDKDEDDCGYAKDGNCSKDHEHVEEKEAKAYDYAIHGLLKISEALDRTSSENASVFALKLAAAVKNQKDKMMNGKDKDKNKAKDKMKMLKEQEKAKAQALKDKNKAKDLKEKEKAQALKDKEKAQALKDKNKAMDLKGKEEAKAKKLLQEVRDLAAKNKDKAKKK